MRYGNINKLSSLGLFRQGGVVGSDPGEHRDGIGGAVRKGVFQGRMHSTGGIILEAERGEGILSRKDMSALGGPVHPASTA